MTATKEKDTSELEKPEGLARVKIIINAVDEKDKSVQVSINGFPYTIATGKEVSVPISVVEVLKNAVEDRYRFQMNESGTKSELVHTKMPRRSFSIVG